MDKEKLLRFAGWTHIPYKSKNGVKIQDDCWLEPGYTSQIPGHWHFDVFIDPNFIFKHVFPKFYKIKIYITEKETHIVITKSMFTSDVGAINKDFTTACLQAIEQAIGDYES